MSESVKITSADFNGATWDSSPFSPAPAPEWLMDALKADKLAVEPGSEDYAWWRVQTVTGAKIVGPGDIIEDEGNGGLRVRYADDSAWRRFGHKYGREYFTA